MKKILSTLLVGAMLVCMAPVAGLFADEAEALDYTSIDSADEYVEFVKAVNDGTYTNNADHKVNVDLDLSSYPVEDVVIKKQVGDLALDFQGHTVSGIVREVTAEGHVSAGILCDYANGFAEFLNVKIKDCSLTVNVPEGYYGLVGGVVGETDRVYVNGVEMENVTIKVTGAGAVGAVYGHKQFHDFRSGDSSVSLKNVLIDAPSAAVGIIVGRQGDNDGAKITITKMEISGTTLKGSNNPTAETYIATGDGDDLNAVAALTVAEGVEPAVALVDNATGYTASSEEDTTPPATDNEPDSDNKGEADVPPTGDVAVFAAVVAVIALAGVAVISKKRTAC